MDGSDPEGKGFTVPLALTDAVEVSAANVYDGEAAPALIERYREQGLKPEATVGDMAYSAAELRQWVALSRVRRS